MFKNTLITSALACLLSACTNEPQAPNILFCFGDDWGYYASYFANPDEPGINDCLQTPAMDQLAEEGVSFNHAYVNVPSCTPSRASVATGCYFWRTGATATTCS